MSTSSQRAGLALIKHFEGCRLHAYPDPATGGRPYTVGWGSTGPDITRNTVWTQAQADARLLADYDRFEAGVLAAVKVPLTQNQLGACVCLIYNIGLTAFRASTLLDKINDRDPAGAAQQFARWNKAAGRVTAGLVARRAAEAVLFQTP